MSDNKYLLPGYYKEGTEANTLLGAFENTVNLLKEYILSAFSQTSASTATWALDDWEKELGITPSAGASDDLRRAVIKAKLMRPPTMTPAQIKAIANCFVPAKDAKIIDPVAPYTFRIVLPSSVPWITELMQQIDEAKPAHLAMEIELDRIDKSNLYVGTIAAMGGNQSIGLSRTRQMNAGFFVGATAAVGGEQKLGLRQTDHVSCNIGIGAIMQCGGEITVLPRGGILNWLNGMEQSLQRPVERS